MKSFGQHWLFCICINAGKQVRVNGRLVKARRMDGALEFHQGKLLFTIPGSRRLRNEGVLMDTDIGTSGLIQAQLPKFAE